MLSCIENVRIGRMSPDVLKRAEKSRRALNLQLSSTSVMDPVFSSAVLSLDIDPDGRHLLSGTSDGSWNIHDTFNFSKNIMYKMPCVSQIQRRCFHRHAIRTVQWYPLDSGLFTTSSSDSRLHLWDANQSGKPADTYELDNVITRHHVNPVVGNLIAACSDGVTTIIDIRVGSSIQVIPENSTKSVETQWSPTNQYQLIVGSDAGHIIEWDIRSTINYRSFNVDNMQSIHRSNRSFLQPAHNGRVCSIRFSANGLQLYSAGKDWRVRRWNVDTESDPCVATLYVGKQSSEHAHVNYELGLSSDTDPPVVYAPKGTSVMVCDMNECVVKKELLGHFQTANCFVYDQVHQQGYSGGLDSSVMVWSSSLTTEQVYMEEKVKQKRYGEIPVKRKLIDD